MTVMRKGFAGWVVVFAGLCVAGGARAEDRPISTTPEPVPTDMTTAQPGGLTADQVGRRAGETSYSAKAAEQSLRAAEARTDAARAGFLPRLTGTARYTRLSDFTPPAIATGAPGIYSVGTADPKYDGTTPGHTTAFAIPNQDLKFGLILDNYLLQANLTIPISDYFLRINQTYTSAIKAEEGLRYDAATARAISAADGKNAYYAWAASRAAVVVAVQNLNDRRAHLNDARNQFAVGSASRADVLRAETAVSQAELDLVRQKNAEQLAAKRVRIAMHVKEDEPPLVPGEGLENPPAPFEGNVDQLTREALSARFEIKSIDANALSAKKTAEAQRAARYPTVSAFADGVYANPNPRWFPAEDKWFGTWDVGAQAIWSPNDILTSNANSADYEARASALEAQRQIQRDNISIEVEQMYQGVKEADFAVESTKRQLASATEAHRVQRELFNNGRGTSATLEDAEADLTRARYDALNAQANARIARVRLDHALGRDTKLVTTP